MVPPSFTFTPALLDRISSHLARRQPEESYDYKTLKHLQACSLVSKAWLPHFQSLIFTRIQGIDVSDTHRSPLSHLTTIISQNPTLTHHVRELSITIPSTWLHPAKSHQTLLRFPNLVSLTIIEDPASRFFQHTLYAALMISIYQLKARGLRVLRLQRLALDPNSDNKWLDTPKTGNVRRISVAPRDTDPRLGFLFKRDRRQTGRSPLSGDFLVAIEMGDIKPHPKTDEEHVHYYYDETLKEVVRCWTQGKDSKSLMEVIKKVEVLDVVLKHPDDGVELRWFFVTMQRVKSIVIDAADIPINKSSFLSLIRPNISESFYVENLQSLTLNLLIDNTSDAYTSVMEDLTSLLYAFWGTRHILQYISITLDMSSPTARNTVLQPWRTIASMLANKTHFPDLKRVNVDISFKVSDESEKVRVLEEFEWEEGLKGALTRAMRELSRGGVLLSGEIALVEG